MRLISCYISAFGRIRDKDMTFAPGVNCYLEPNGSGKSTAADFLCAMFYGMDGYTKSSVQFTDRLHYYPAGSLAFGGTVTFEKNGAEYRIERFFGEKSTTADRLTVYKNGVETQELGECPGITVFGIDRESFVRTAFFNGRTGNGGATPDLNRALHGTVAAPAAGGSAAEAAARLEEAAGKLQGKRKNSGILANLRQELTDTSRHLLQLRETEDSLTPLYAQRAQLKEAISGIGAQRKAAADWLALEGKQAVLREKLKSAAETEEKRKNIDAKYPAGIPGQDVTNLLRTAGRLSEAVGSPAEPGSPAAVFAGEIPAAADYAETQEKIRALCALEQEKAALERQAPPPDSNQDNPSFAEGGADTVLAEGEALCASIRRTDGELAAQRAGFSAQAHPDPSCLPFGIGLLILAFGFLLAGFFLQSAHTAAAVALFVLGALSLAAGALLLYLPAVKRRKAEEKAQTELAEKEAQRNALAARLQSMLSRCGYEGEDLPGTYERFAAEYQTYRKQKEEAQVYAQKTEQLNVQMAEQRAEIADFLSFHAIPSADLPGVDLLGALHRAREMYGAYISCTEARAAAEDYLTRLSLPMPACGEETAAAAAMDGDRMNRSLLNSELEKKRAEADAYRREELPAVLPPKPEHSAAEVEAKLQELNGQLAALDRRIEDTERETARIGEYEARERNLRERIADTEHRAKVYLAAAKAIRDADNRLTEKYIAPVRDRFDTYADLLGSITGERVTMDISYRVRTEHDGVLLDERYFSEGQKTLCSLCLRLAMIDNIYTKEKPFLIFDDPFSGLDADKMAKAARLLTELSDCQILYFCCHESRQIGKEQAL